MKYIYRMHDIDPDNLDIVTGFKTLEEALEYATTEQGWFSETVMVERLTEGNRKWETLGSSYSLGWRYGYVEH